MEYRIFADTRDGWKYLVLCEDEQEGIETLAEYCGMDIDKAEELFVDQEGSCTFNPHKCAVINLGV